MLSFFKVDVLTGVLTGPTATLSAPDTPEGVAFVGNFMYVANAEGSVSAYQLGGSFPGVTLTGVPGSPFPAGTAPTAVAANGLGFVYVADSGSSDIWAYSADPTTGMLTPLPGSPFPAGTDPGSIQVVDLNPVYGGPTYAFVTNAGSDDVSVFSTNSDGSLTPVPGSPFPAGSRPSSVTAEYNLFPPPFVFVANSKSNDISVFRVDPVSGELTPVAGSPFPADGTDPVSIAAGGGEFAGFGGPNGAPFLYVANAGSNNMSVFSINLSTGALTPVSGSPFAVGKSPQAVVYVEVPK